MHNEWCYMEIVFKEQAKPRLVGHDKQKKIGNI